jgi:hypothetical protein
MLPNIPAEISGNICLDKKFPILVFYLGNFLRLRDPAIASTYDIWAAIVADAIVADAIVADAIVADAIVADTIHLFKVRLVLIGGCRNKEDEQRVQVRTQDKKILLIPFNLT